MQQNTSPQPGTPEYAQAMANKFDSQLPQNQAPAQDSQAEQLILGKFKSTDDLVKAYQELERKLGQGAAKPQNQTPSIRATTGEDTQQQPPALEGDQQPNQQQQAQQVVADAGLDFDALTAKVEANGQLDDSDYDALEAKGISRQMVDNYIAGQQAIRDRATQEVLAVVGGMEQFQTIAEWAGRNLSQAEVDAFNRVMEGRDMAAAKLAMAGLKAQYEAANGTNPKLVTGGTGEAPLPAFRSTAEMVQAMKDPRYATDPAYQADVRRRLANSNIF